MTDQQHERCECGREAKASTGNIGTSVSCKGDGQLCCWWGPTCANKFAAWAEWDRVMRAVRLRKCDGDHGAPQCDDKECWLKEAPDA